MSRDDVPNFRTTSPANCSNCANVVWGLSPVEADFHECIKYDFRLPDALVVHVCDGWEDVE
jgi:hypothetical protein